MSDYYYVDGQPVLWTDLIRMAERQGYESHGIASTSEAARWLRELGYRVTDKADE